METIRNHSIMKNIGKIQNFGKNIADLKNSNHNLKVQFYILKRCRPTKRDRYLLFMFERETAYH